MAQSYNDMVEQSKELLKDPVLFYTFNINQMKSSGDTVWPTQKAIMEETLLFARMLLAGLEGSRDFVDDEIENLSDFFNRIFVRLCMMHLKKRKMYRMLLKVF